ncbi:MAG: hypothetical protein AAF908_02330 [Pseudomonadota bacterium]
MTMFSAPAFVKRRSGKGFHPVIKDRSIRSDKRKLCVAHKFAAEALTITADFSENLP